MIDHLKQIYIDGELEVIDTSVYYNRVFKKDYVVALNLSGSAVDDPDVRAGTHSTTTLAQRSATRGKYRQN